MLKPSLALILCALLALLSGCASPAARGADTDGAYTVVDARGAAVRIPRKPARVLTADLTYDTIVLGLVPPDRLAAVSAFDDDPGISSIARETKDITPKIHDLTSIPLERILETEPDLIITSTFTSPQHIESYRRLGFPVIVCQGPESIAETEEAVRLIAEALQEPEAGARVLAEMNRQLAEIDETLARRADAPPVGMLLSVMQSYGGPGSMFHELCTRARIENALAKAGVKNGEFLPKERILWADPDFFLLSAPRPSDVFKTDDMHDAFLKDPALQGLRGLARVRKVPDRYLYAASQNLVYAVKYLANTAYDEPIFDMSEEHLIKGY